ncbi:hypothetical protein ARMSODRAFT_882881, partial [Armillaria solidipes]
MSQLQSDSSNYEHILRWSYRTLQTARADAANDPDRQYDSASTRTCIQTSFLEKFGKPAYDWQVDVAESLVLGLDTVLIAGTGAGKMMPFMMPLLVDSSKKVLVISPLNVLQQDQ